MARHSNTSAPVVVTRNFRANPARDGVSFVEFLNGIRTEVEALIEMGEFEMAEGQARGLAKLEMAKGYVSGQRLLKKIAGLKNEKQVAIQQENIRAHREASFADRKVQEEESRRRAELAAQAREADLQQRIALRELSRKAKEDKAVWEKCVNEGVELDNSLTHNPFAALVFIQQGVKKQEDGSLVEVVTEEKVEDVLALYTIAIEACQEMGQWEEVQELLGEEFFNRNVTQELLNELHEAMELVADNQ